MVKKFKNRKILVIRDCRGRIDDVGYGIAIALRTCRCSFRFIGASLNVEPSTVHRALRKCAPADKPKREPPPVTSVKKKVMRRRRTSVEIYARQLIGRGRKKRRRYPSCKAIALKMTADNNPVSSRTVLRDLNAVGLFWKAKPKGCKSYPRDRAVRLHWCKELMKNMPAKPLFSDEKYFSTNYKGQLGEYCFRNEHPSKKEQTTFATYAHFWAVIGQGVKKLVRLPNQRLNKEMYKLRCLQQCLVPEVGMHGNSHTFLYDGDRSHDAVTCINYLNNKGVPHVKLPPRSPELNPLENLWWTMEYYVYQLYCPQTSHELTDAAERVWKDIPQSVIDDLVATFPERVAKCIAKGGA